jgi:hypothetical protein
METDPTSGRQDYEVTTAYAQFGNVLPSWFGSFRLRLVGLY